MDILTACKTHGPRNVYDAACRRMSGDRAALPSVGLPDPATLGDAHRIMSEAYRLMDDAEQLADQTSALIDLARLPR